MPQVDEILSALRLLAKRNPAVKEKLLKTSEMPSPVRALCELAASYGYPLFEMDLVLAGEEYYANMRRSTNGGGENSPLLAGEDDYYEMFITDLRTL